MIYPIAYNVENRIVREARNAVKKIIYDNFLYKTKEFSTTLEIAKRKYKSDLIAFIRTIRYFQKKYPFLRMKLHRKQWLFLWEIFVKKREIVIAKGGNKSGKTTALAYAVIVKALENPKNLIWVVTINYDMGKNIVARKIADLVGDNKKAKWNTKHNTFNIFKTTVNFKSGQSDDDTFQSASVDFVAFDERPPRSSTFDEAYARTIDTQGQVIMAYTPLREVDFIYDYFIATNKRWNENNFAIVEMATTENIFAQTAEKIRALSADEDEYQARILGYYRIEVDMVRITEEEMKQVIKYPTRRLMLVEDMSTGRVVESEISATEDAFALFKKEGSFGIFEIFREFPYFNSPDYRNQIVVGVDVAGGIGKDFSVALFYSKVGTLYGALFSNNESISAFTKQLIHVIRKYYGIYSVISFERNGLGIALYEIATSMGYTNFYKPPNSKVSGVYIGNEGKTTRVHMLREMISRKAIDIHYRMAKELSDFRMKNNQKPEDFISATLILTDLIDPLSLETQSSVSQETLTKKQLELENKKVRSYSLL
jgi:phage terminase large subunit-like protein